MRSNMDPLTPATSTLSPAVSHIAETAASLAELPRHQALRSENADAGAAKRAQQETVKWVLGAPRRLQALMSSGKVEAAGEDWAETRQLLDRWDGVAGVEKVRDECLKIMGEHTAAIRTET